ncbi:MAG: hypothetical protein IJX55_03085 [Clostridia bacterium]|nr:hypothetical protein [Clostridia bacterium]MBQ8862528.1 hypothetical protein [Clostridia bacterium]
MSNEEIIERIRIRKENFVHNVIWLRKYYCIPKKRMAELLGICVSSWNKIEKGIFPGKMTSNIVINICENFRVTSDSLFEKRFGE